MDEVGDLRKWLEGILGETVDWEVNPRTVRVLNDIRSRNVSQEKYAEVVFEEIEKCRSEYEGEVKRLDRILSELGVDDRFITGPSTAYLQVLTESCASLNEENIGSGLEAAAAKLLVQQAEGFPRTAGARAQIESVKADTLKVYGQLDRLGEAIKISSQESEEDVAKAQNQSKKLDFLHAKEKQYKANLDKEESILMKNTNGDQTLRHSAVENLARELQSLQKELETAKRQITGYLDLPPSLDLAKVEISKVEGELRELSEQVNHNISTMHL